MQKKQSKNSKGNINEIWKTWRGKSTKKECSDGENCQEDLQQESYLNDQIKDMTKNIGEDWKGIGGNGRARNWRKEE